MCSCETKKNREQLSTTAHLEQKKNSDSVISNISGNKKVFLINPLKENILTSKKGILFSIPANAFVKKDGLNPKGEVQIAISEYHNPADILVSGIRMQYKKQKDYIQMESAGMFSISATFNNEELSLATGKDIQVQVPSKNRDANFNLYYFDPIINEWVQTTDSLPISNNESNSTLPSKKVNANQLAAASAAINVEWIAIEANKRVIDGKTITLVRPDCSYKNNNFNFTVSTDQFPELNMYKESVWVGCSTREEKQVTSAFESDTFIKASIIQRESPLNMYLISFEFKHTKFNAYMKVAGKDAMCEINEEIYFSYYNNRPMDEKKVEKIKNDVKKHKQQDVILRRLAINKLGLWNCDRLYVLPEIMIITPRFRNSVTGEYYESTTTYMIDKNLNSVWSFAKEITLNPNSENIVLFVNTKGRMCYARLNTFDKKEKTFNLIIDVTEISDTPDSTDELDVLIKSM